MGLEARCTAHYGNKVSEGRAFLEAEALVFRGDFRVTIPLAKITAAEARGADLHVDSAAGKLVLEIGPAAAQWEKKILHAPTILEKLGVKEGQNVCLYGAIDLSFVDKLKAAGASVSTDPHPDCDLVLVAADNVGHLAKVPRAAENLAPHGALWIVYPKGQRAITQNDAMKSGKEAGLVDVKVASFSPTHTALKFVIPVHRRGK
jgi:hypothetical protein